jgi:hypothetical protein
MTLWKKMKLVVAISGLIVSNFSFAQQVTRPYLDSLLNISDTGYKKKTDVFFVINGIPYDTSQVETVISKYDRKHLADAMFLGRERQSNPFYRDVAVIVFASLQTKETKRKHWRDAKKLFSDLNATKPQLLIDQTIIAPEKAAKTFNSVKLNDIMYLDIKQSENGKQVRVWRTE